LDDPAAGVDLLYTNLEERILELMHLSFRLVTSATVATRVVRVTATNGSVVHARAVGPNTQTASQTAEYSFGVGNASLAIIGTILNRTSPLRVGIIVTALTTVETAIENIQAADQVSAVSIYFKQWLSTL